MSGEDSKSSGEIGETMAHQLLQSMGWGSLPKGIKVQCVYPKEHDQRSHGEDRVFVYNSPFQEDTTEVVHISVKHNKDGYPEKRDPFKRILKEHLEQLATIVQCGQFDQTVSAFIKAVGPRQRIRHLGLLIWLHSNPETIDVDRRLDASQMQIPSGLKDFPALLIDSGRASFIHTVLSHFQATGLGAPTFYYPRLGSMPSANPLRYGDILPIELVVSDIIPISVLGKDRQRLYLYLREKFSQSALRKAYSLARSFGDAWVEDNDIHIGFSDYVEGTHNNDKEIGLSAFGKSASSVTIFSYKPNLLNLS
ncbi:MAG: hypothetical protein KGN39_04795 [Betaproteobacteria bacterium]|nr:hypothetical protein [Betaproteobacteria bacterium]